MRRIWITAVCVGISFFAAFAGGTPKPEMSNDPLTPEQIEVYRAVLKEYLKGSDGALNLANRTEPLDQSDKECFKGIGVKAASVAIIHKVDPSLVLKTKIILVDPDQQQSTIKENDPQKLLKKAIDEHEKVTNEQLDRSVNQAFATGLFTLSEIAFDKEHRRAVVAYSFVCGGLCGNGNTLILRKMGQVWKVVKRCGGWVS